MDKRQSGSTCGAIYVLRSIASVEGEELVNADVSSVEKRCDHKAWLR
jgi:hypothetical protein